MMIGWLKHNTTKPKEKGMNLPLPLRQPYQPDFDSITRHQNLRLLAIPQRHILTQGRIQNIS